LEPISTFHPIASKATVVIFAHDNEHIITGHESGQLTLYHAKSGEEVTLNQHAHREIVTDIQMAPDRSYFITSSKDKSAKVWADGLWTTGKNPHTLIALRNENSGRAEEVSD
jgi:translation initiation factor 3 subunit I